MSSFHVVATLDPDASLLEMSKDGHFVFTVHEDNRIAPGKSRVHVTGRVVPDSSDDIRNDAIRWGEDRLAEGKIILVFRAFTLMRSA